MSGSAAVASAIATACSHLDSTNPVSIQEAIDHLDQYQNQVRIHLFRLLQKLANQSGESLDEALGQLAAQPDKVISESPEASILPHIGTYRDIVARIKGLVTEVSRKHAAEDVEKQVQEFEERLAEGHLTDAAYCCVRLVKMAGDAEEELAEREARQQQAAAAAGAEGGEGDAQAEEGEEGAAPRVTAESVALLQETAQRCGTQLREALDACCDEAVHVDPSGSCVVVRSALRGGATRVPDLFAALQVLGLQETYLKQMTDRLVDGVLQPMLAAPCRITQTPAAEPGAPASLAWQPEPPGSAPAPRSADRRASGGGTCDPEHCCQALLRLLAASLLEFDEGLMEVFGAPFWRAAADCYIACVARPFIASNPEDVEGCEAVVAAAADLEAMAESLNFTNGEEPYLAPAVESLARHALSNRQEKYLEQARQLLLGHGAGHVPGFQGAGHGSVHAGAEAPGWETVAAGQALQVDEEYYRRLAAGELQDWEAQDPPTGLRPEGPLLATGRYLITRRMQALAGLVEGLVQDACAGSRAVSRALLSAVSSIALMARALPPAGAAASPEQLASVPQLGLLTATDLTHLAGQLLLLSQAYGDALEGATGEPAVPPLLEEALELRAAARVVMREQLAHQYASLDDILAGLDRLRGVGSSDAKVGMRQRRVVQQLLHSLGRLGRSCTEVLPPEEGVAAAGAVLDHALGQLVAAVLGKGDMSHDECVELAALLGPLAEGAVDSWLGAAKAGGSELSGIPIDVVAAAITARSLQLRKLQCVLRVITSDSVGAIAEAWDRGDLAALAAPELEALLLAISEDSPARRALLEKLQ
ncbi:hypothetical protein HYH03_004091 [Edaphochlamys debaryana]|uniref:ZW10 C-terminal helical domain-containing protein n=1 Tax=Edaphochlamys debaryana TaxID=47281 RepID=A0A835Y865_9CHLO|nr:hypothetical protein HYH03_004091 [Edaphochlamys debaryana]|eukprot:KAG2497821.1 hypothetical protein HYH03_004091 [Edaphochlamys debaryana]